VSAPAPPTGTILIADDNRVNQLLLGRCFAAGMNDYVAKPIRADELAVALKRARPLRNGAAGSAETRPSLDAGALQNLRDLGGDDFLREVVEAFLTDAPALIASLRSSLEQQNGEELRRAAHTLKSNGATLGAEEFAELCRAVEQQVKAGRLDDLSQLVDRIEQEFPPLRDALNLLRPRAGGPHRRLRRARRRSARAPAAAALRPDAARCPDA
jgi:HPt (histidine-containing phosphotransfer) domain-containing protein